jgi:hypothetical protein
MKYKFSHIFNTLLLLILGLSSCDSNKFDVNVDNQNVTVDWFRFEHDLTGLATKPDFNLYNDSLTVAYGSFYRFYSGRVMNFGNINSPRYERNVMSFLMDKNVHQLFRTVDSSFNDLSNVKTQVEHAFTYYHYYFPYKKTPVVVSAIAGLNRNIIVTDSVLCVGLDMYLGDSNEIYTLAQLPQYISSKCKPEYMPFDMMRGWVLSEFEPVNKRDDVLSQIISYGKTMYLMDALFPFAEDHLKIGYHKDQITWCEQNEVTVWSRIIEEQQLYSTDLHVIRSLTGPGPFSTGFPKESPAQIGYWLGWQIVRKYMDTNPDVTIEELMKMEDAQSLLRQSKYKPR